MSAPSSEIDGEGPADAGSGAGDGGDATFEVLHIDSTMTYATDVAAVFAAALDRKT